MENEAYILITPELAKRFEELGPQDIDDPIVVVKYFNPCGSATWYVTAYFPEERKIFCYVTGLGFDEWGYTSLDELRELRCPLRQIETSPPLNLPVERDLYFDEIKFSELKKKFENH